MRRKDAATAFKKVWYFIWHDDSVLSWIVNVILAFILIKYIVYPLLGFILGTSFPIVAVVSESMEHNANFNGWWEKNAQWYAENNITKEQFAEFSFRNGFNKGDIIFLIHKAPGEIQVGDVIVFISHRFDPRPDPIIHRVVKKWSDNGIYLQTKGDNNGRTLNDCDSTGCIDETTIQENQVLGKALFRIPLLGWIKIIFVDVVAEPYCALTNNLFPCRGI
ncbi:signal peptidase I [Candidatus Woesearchaeota archaeon]|nr:signal peptidase I [Candidatus Woesearchaeota archaeon]